MSGRDSGQAVYSKVSVLSWHSISGIVKVNTNYSTCDENLKTYNCEINNKILPKKIVN